jgi:hypothetical protein
MQYVFLYTINLPWQLKLGHHQRTPQKYKNNHGRKYDSNVKNLSEKNKSRKRNNLPTYAYKRQFDAKLADKYSLFKTRSKRSEPAFDFSPSDFCSYISVTFSESFRDSTGSSLCGSSTGISPGSSPAVQVKFVK